MSLATSLSCLALLTNSAILTCLLWTLSPLAVVTVSIFWVGVTAPQGADFDVIVQGRARSPWAFQKEDETCQGPPLQEPRCPPISGRRGEAGGPGGDAVEQLPQPWASAWATPSLPSPSLWAQVLGAISESMETTEEAGNLKGGGG